MWRTFADAIAVGVLLAVCVYLGVTLAFWIWPK
jgi:hypothetical protein